MKLKPLRVVFAGGGTGGHIFPAIALADELKKNAPGIEITFIGAKAGLEGLIVPRYGYELKTLDVEGIKRRGVLKGIRAVMKAAAALLGAILILKRLRPAGVMGCGGYSSAPVLLAAKVLGIKTAILEQNALPGITNRLLGRFAQRAYTAFEEAGAYFRKDSTRLLGNPVRRAILDAGMGNKTEAGAVFTILVLGGSQGALAVNSAMLDAIDCLKDMWPLLRVVHATGDAGFGAVEEGYGKRGFKGADVKRFIDDMATAYAASDIVVTRAGATTIAEITALGRASVLIPYPYAADDHQRKNAMALVKKGAAIMLEQHGLSGESLAKEIKRLYSDRDELEDIKRSAKNLGAPDAAAKIAGDFLRLMEGAS
ncbi:MAG: undecaprenyldiphospho-muramoylpentapeptide beta-N-acetylglucosaminyltransferase [Deltaproteobacteria bacterium]